MKNYILFLLQTARYPQLSFFLFTWSVLQSLRELRVVVVVLLLVLMWCFYLQEPLTQIFAK